MLMTLQPQAVFQHCVTGGTRWSHLVYTYGYHVNATKTWLISKEHCYTEASTLFEDTQVNVTSEGRPHLGAAIGTESYINSYVKRKVEQWYVELECLALVATTQPHSAFAAFTHGFTSKWTHLARTIPNISYFLQPLEDVISTCLIPSLSGRQAPNNLERNLLSLPARLSGIGLLKFPPLNLRPHKISPSHCLPIRYHLTPLLS